MFPTVMLVLNVSSVAAIWFGGEPHRRRRDADRRADRVPQLPDPDPHVGDDGDVRRGARAPRLGERGPHRGGARRGVVGRRRRRTRSPSSAPRARSSCATSSSSTRAPSTRCCATSRSRRSPGETTAIIGSTGAGKTTLLNLVPRLFDATGGTVLVDGVDVRDIEPELLWSRIGLVPQKPYLFSGTVASNLRYANPDATDDELWAGARDRPGPRLRVGDARRARRADQPGRHQRVRRAAPAPRDRPRARPPARHLPVRRLVLRARPRDRRPPARRARAGRRRRGDGHRRPAGVDDHQRRPDPRARGRPAGRARHAPRAARDLPDLRRDRRVAAHARRRRHEPTPDGRGQRASDRSGADERRRADATPAEDDRQAAGRGRRAAASAAAGARPACRSSGRRTSRTRPAGSRPGCGPRASASRPSSSSRSRASRCS